ncbi:hypothetical protein JK221_12225 [Providencia sp. JGM172]|uniref:hypothetical protein n=2 Tax=Providencia TaxID=586 RepID=UPI001BAACF05|nr:hypothetical protein [Providencia sp. JGM172]MBS0998085.1 hypothetical protein [Providencia sp. JGM178]
MFELLKIAIQIGLGFYLTNVVGKKIALSYQKKNSIEQLKTKKAEAEVEKIQAIILNLITISSERRFAATDLIFALEDKEKNQKKIDKLRDENKIKVNEWNISLTVLNMKMFNLDLYNESKLMENTVHYEFRCAHNHIRNYIENNKLSSLEEAKKHLDYAYAATRRISNELASISKERWDTITSDNTEPLSIYNIHKASNWTLIRALFQSSKNGLSVPRS